MTKRLIGYALCAVLVSINPVLSAQPPTDPIGEALFPPELVMQHQQAIGLSEEQKTFLVAEIQKAQARFTELQWQLQHAMETLVALVREERVDEQKVLAQLDRVLNLEREIKRAQFSLLVRIRNKLTPEQRTRLHEIKTRLRGN
jgi:Spy/CpxP family protein refolding chaperone